jgi:hypothetical protein
MSRATSPMSLFDTTRRLLLDSPVPLLRLGKQLVIPYQWLIKFRNGEIPDPSVNRVQLIYETLAGRDLEV